MNFRKILLVFSVVALSLTDVAANTKVDLCKAKIKELKSLIKQAKKADIDVNREEGAIWMANEFMFYADWDAKNVEHNRYQFSCWDAYKDDAAKMARELPDWEREQIIMFLDQAIEELTDVINGDIVRRDFPDIDWANIKAKDGHFESNGRPVFVHDYCSRGDFNESLYSGLTSSGSMNLSSIDYATGEISKSAQSMFKRYNGNSGEFMLGHGQPPKYIMERDPEAQDGLRVFTQYDIDNPTIRDSWSRVIEAMVPQVKNYSFTDFGYILSNEPHWFTEKDVWATGNISKHTVAKFRAWLQETHKEISAMNQLWGSNFASFEEVTIEIPFDKEIKTTPMYYDWCKFNQNRVSEWFEFLTDNIKRHDPEALIHVKLIPRLFTDDIRDHGLDFERITAMSGIIGNDSKIQGRLLSSQGPEWWEPYYVFSWNEVGIAYDFMESVAPGMPNNNSESHFLSSAGWRDLYLTPEWTRAAYWLATMQGMDVSKAWYWPREKDGGPTHILRRTDIEHPRASGKAYPGSVAQQPAVANEVNRTYMDLNAFSEEMVAVQSLARPARIFYTETSAINCLTYMASINELYYPLYFKGNAVGFVTPNVINTQDNASWDVTMIRNTEFVTVDEFKSVQKYLDNGGTIIIDNKSLKKDQYGRPLNMTLNPSKGKIITCEDVDQFLSEADAILMANGSKPDIEIAETNGTGRPGCAWRSFRKDENTTVVCLINIGCTDAKLELSSNEGVSTVRDLMIGKRAKSSFEMKPFEVMMLEIEHKPDPRLNF
ncbi:MAG: beta-galactosidase [Rikenellaceae bacterium]